MFFIKRKLQKKTELELDEILFDTKNMPGYETEGFVGK